MNSLPPSNDVWITCPQCNSPMPSGLERCQQCQSHIDLNEGVELARTGELDQALVRFQRVCVGEIGGDLKCKAYYYSGSIFAKQGKLDKAELAWRKCLHLNPGYKQAKKKMVEIILQKPKKKWTPEERVWVEGSEFAKAKALPGKTKSSRRWITWSIAIGVIGIGFVGGYLLATRAIKYFTFDRHIEQVRFLASTDQINRSLQYFNDNFRVGDSAHKRDKAEKTLAPIFKELGFQYSARGDLEKAKKLLEISSGFNPHDQEVTNELYRLRKLVRDNREEPE